MDNIQKAAQVIHESDAVIFTAGAGMGVDSGLPDFRGENGFWKAYPPLRDLGIDFKSAANPDLFKEDPHLAWAFYGHRYNLYANTNPHAGYVLQRLIASRRSHFVFTSNVDDAYVKAGFDSNNCVDYHGNIFYWQSSTTSMGRIWEARPQNGFPVELEDDSFKARGPLPRCPFTGHLARPNILMFDDEGWNSSRAMVQDSRLGVWGSNHFHSKIAIIECGAGTVIPSVRRFGEQVRNSWRATLIRINPRECEGGDINIPLGAKDAMVRINDSLRHLGFYEKPSTSDLLLEGVHRNFNHFM